MPLTQLMQPLAYYVHQYTLSILRPMAAAVLLASWSKNDGPALWMLDPSGQVTKLFHLPKPPVGRETFGGAECRLHSSQNTYINMNLLTEN